MSYSGLSFSELGQSLDVPLLGCLRVLSGTAYAEVIPAVRDDVCDRVFPLEVPVLGFRSR